MSLKNQIQEDLIGAMKARDQDKLAVLRLLSSEIKKQELDGQAELGQTQLVSLLHKQIKQRKESAEQFEKGGRSEAAEKELKEADIINNYLPEQLSEEAIIVEVSKILELEKLSSPADIGKAMAAAKKQLGDRADMSQVSPIVKRLLAPQ